MSANPEPTEHTPPYRWTCATLEADFAARDGAGALASRDKMWLLGGWNPGDKVHFPKICNSEVWSSTDGAAWTLEHPRAPWEGRHTAGYAVHNDKMWIVGGDCNQMHYQNDVWSSADGIHWDLVNGNVPWAPRVLHYTVVHDGRIWVMGGQTNTAKFSPGPEVFYNDVWSSPDGVTWTRVTEKAPWPPRGMIGGSAVMNGRIWILGGGTYGTPTTPTRKRYDDVWSSTDGVNWEQHTEHAPWKSRSYHDVAVFDGKLWVPGGGQREGEEPWRNGYFVSYDNGRTWPEWHTVCTGLQDEKDMLDLPDGRLLAMIRANSALRLYRSYSDDEGQTWSPIEPTELPGQCPALIYLASGDILCAYRDMRPGHLGMSCGLSHDLGQSWTPLGHLYLGANRDCAYPSMVHLPGGRIYCVFYTAAQPEAVTGTCEIHGLILRDRTWS